MDLFFCRRHQLDDAVLDCYHERDSYLSCSSLLVNFHGNVVAYHLSLILLVFCLVPLLIPLET
jgi:hypothetical protein